MTTLAAQVVFHPVVSQSLKFGGSTIGRDKLYRAIQYASRFLAWYFEYKGNKVSAFRWTALKAHLGTARKLMRLGKPMEHLQAALRASASDGFSAETLLFIARHVGYFAFLSYDAIAWAHAVRFINLSKETAEKVLKRSFQFWFAGILFSLLHGSLKSARLVREAKALRQIKAWDEKDLAQEATRETNSAVITAAREKAHKQLVVDLLDIWIPASGAGLLKVNEGFLGIVGFISSIMGAKTQWDVVNGKTLIYLI
jgi:peroxin-11B